MRTLILSLMLAAAVASAGLLAPALQEKMARVDGREQIGVMIALAEQFDGAQVIRTIKNKQERWETTVNGLRSLATSTQAGLLSELAAWEADGKVSDVQPLWIVNAVYCKATPAVIQAVSDRAEVWFVEWNLIPTENALAIAGAATAPADGTDNPEWNVQIVKADSVWHVYGYMGENVIVGHIDTGCDYTHPDLSGHMWTDPNYPNHGWDFENNDNDPMDVAGHGTHTAGTVASNGTAGDTCGMAPMAQIMSCRTKTSIGTPYPDTVAENTVMNSMQFCVAPPLSPTNHAQLLTMSLGWYHSWSPRRGLWRECVTNVAAAGLPYFIANGNEGGGSPPDNVRTPGDCPGPWKHPAEPAGGLGGAISIGATDNADNIASFSSQGPVTWDTTTPYNDYPYPPGLYKPDFSAPGVNITSCWLGGGYYTGSGTSAATPCAAGVAALMLEKNPNLLPEQVSEIMQNSVRPLGTQPKNNTYGTGRIDAMLCIANTPPPGPMHDVAMRAVLAPAGRIDPLTPLAPTVMVRNRGTFDETNITFYCKVESSGTQIYHRQTVLASLVSAQTDTVTFPNWNVGPAGQTYDLTFWHAMSQDTNRRNDTVSASTTASDQIRILMCYSDDGIPDSLYAGLRALGDSVALLGVRNYTPTLDELQVYDAVGAQSNFPYADSVGFGNVLADYVDAGGGVVLGNFSFTSGAEMSGRIMTGDYATIRPGVFTHQLSGLGWFNTGHPLMAGISAVSDQYMSGGASFMAESVASWSDGRPYVAVAANQKVVGLNQYPGNYATPERSGDWVLVWHNAFGYVSTTVSGVHEFDPLAPGPAVSLAAAPNLGASIVRGVLGISSPLALRGASSAPRGASQPGIRLYDANGRKALDLQPGPNDVSRLVPGVYFVRRPDEFRVRRVLIVR